MKIALAPVKEGWVKMEEAAASAGPLGTIPTPNALMMNTPARKAPKTVRQCLNPSRRWTGRFVPSAVAVALMPRSVVT